MLERVYPGVFLTEVAFQSHPVEGVPTSTPEWTDANRLDPGISLLQLFAWSAESLVYRANTLVPLHAAAIRRRHGDG